MLLHAAYQIGLGCSQMALGEVVRTPYINKAYNFEFLVTSLGSASHLMAFQTSSSDFCLGISSVHAGAAVSSVCFSPCLCRLVRPGTGDTGGSAVCACCFGKMASAARMDHASVHLWSNL